MHSNGTSMFLNGISMVSSIITFTLSLVIFTLQSLSIFIDLYKFDKLFVVAIDYVSMKKFDNNGTIGTSIQSVSF
jgi:hypothetical protein